jgi:esterase/lipase superfamily enzyme
LDWDTLVAESRRRHRRQALPIRLAWVQELGRFPALLSVERTLLGLALDPQDATRLARATTAFQAEIQRRLDLTPRKEVYVYVHGFNNDFEWASMVAAQLWHYLPRQGVPVIYTWPAGRGGLRGYTYDRESSEFTVGHLKQTLRALSACPGVERIHLIAHSRGTDVASSAVRELLLEQRGVHAFAARVPKLDNLVLIAPDLDFEVAGQRLSAELVPLAVNRLTVYVCERDRAVNLANWFYEGVRRLGQLRIRDFTAEQKRQMRNAPSVQFVDARVKVDLLGHGYFHNNPAVSSDLLQLLRENCDAGDDACRPLEREDGIFWKITDDYLAPPGR